MRFGVVGRMDPGMRQVVEIGYRGNFGGECGAPHGNQWRVCDVAVRKLCVNRRSCGLRWCVGLTRGGDAACSQLTSGNLVIAFFKYRDVVSRARYVKPQLSESIARNLHVPQLSRGFATCPPYRPDDRENNIHPSIRPTAERPCTRGVGR